MQRPGGLKGFVCSMTRQAVCVCGYYPHSYWETPERVLCSFSTKLGFRSREKRNLQPQYPSLPGQAQSGVVSCCPLWEHPTVDPLL